MSEPLIEVSRGPVVETIHRGDIVALNASGQIMAWVGDPDKYTFLRSSAKPIQALSVILSGAAEAFSFTPRELALISSSHNAEAIHIDTLLSILHKAGIKEECLQCGAHPPIHQESAMELFRAGRVPGMIHSNCSGKHAGMLAVCKKMGFELEGYLDQHHPVQQMAMERVSVMTGCPVEEMQIGIDGCGVPVHAMPLRHMALAFARLADPQGLPPEYQEAVRRIVAAMQAHPEMVAGTGRVCSNLMTVAGGDVVSKSGAAGLYCIGHLPTRIGVAVKAEDGNGKVAAAAALEFLGQMGFLSDSQLERLRDHHKPIVKNVRGDKCGAMQPIFRLTLGGFLRGERTRGFSARNDTRG